MHAPLAVGATALQEPFPVVGEAGLWRGLGFAVVLHHRHLLGKLCRAGYETVHEMLSAAAVGIEGFRTGLVVVAQTAGDAPNGNPHIHGIKILNHLKSRGIEPGRDPPTDSAGIATTPP